MDKLSSPFSCFRSAWTVAANALQTLPSVRGLLPRSQRLSILEHVHVERGQVPDSGRPIL